MSAEQYAFPLSFAQERLWFLEQLQPGRQAYSISGAARLEGALSTEALDRALRAIVARHETLRTTVAELKGSPVQIVSEEARLEFPVVDLSSTPPAERDADVRRLVAEEAARPFDLARGPLFRPVLYRLGPSEHVLLVCIHHIVSDGWSVGILLRELKALYSVEPATAALPELEVQYGDYVEWQRESLKGEALERELEYWRAKLGGLRPVDLPADRPRPAELSLAGRRHRFALSPGLTAALKDLSGREGATLFMTLLAGFKVLLARYSGGRDVVVGSPIAGRDRPELEALIGFFVNTLVLRTDLRGDPTLREVVARVKETCLGAYANQQLPFGRLVEELHPQRDLSRNPLFQVMFALQNLPIERLELPQVTLTPLDLDRGAAQFDLSLFVSESTDGLAGILEYSTDLFDPQTAERMVTHLARVLETMAEAPDTALSAVGLLTPEERDDVARWNATERTHPAGSVHERIVAVSRTAPGRVAAECGAARLTYGELEERSRRLAARLAGAGVRPGVPVGVYLERSLEMLVGLLGILRAGGAYVPLDPGHPPERLARMIEDSGLGIVVTSAGLRASLPAPGLLALDPEGEGVGDEVAASPVPVGADDLAYLIFTSGSTGRPKGVAVGHRSLANLLDSMAAEPGLDAGDVLLSVTTLSFDIAGLEVFLPLVQGAKVVLATRDEAGDGRALAALIESRGATVMQATPATWRLMLDAGWQGRSALKVLCGGEALPPELAGELLGRCRELWNVYGPTETTIWSSCHRVQPAPGPVPIGRPIANTQLHVLDADLNPLPVGVPGELYIGGAGLARGYWGRPDLTAERFVPDPFAGAGGLRMYRTGDVARRLRDGTIECLGRADHQVKVRGFRIELGEIEVALRRYPGIEGAVVIAQGTAGGDRRLVACLTHGQQDQPNVTALRDHLKALLPVYMVPSSFTFLDGFPLTPNGKVDRNALARLDSGQTPGQKAYVPPRTPTEQLMAELWREALGVPRVGARDNFFDLGGHSLLAMRVLAEVEKKTGHRLHPRDVIFQTLEQLAAACDAAQGPTTESERSLPGRLLGVLRGFIGGDPSSEAGAG